MSKKRYISLYRIYCKYYSFWLKFWLACRFIFISLIFWYLLVFWWRSKPYWPWSSKIHSLNSLLKLNFRRFIFISDRTTCLVLKLVGSCYRQLVERSQLIIWMHRYWVNKRVNFNHLLCRSRMFCERRRHRTIFFGGPIFLSFKFYE